jgi:hypothetical protein
MYIHTLQRPSHSRAGLCSSVKRFKLCELKPAFAGNPLGPKREIRPVCSEAVGAPTNTNRITLVHPTTSHHLTPSSSWRTYPKTLQLQWILLSIETFSSLKKVYEVSICTYRNEDGSTLVLSRMLPLADNSVFVCGLLLWLAYFTYGTIVAPSQVYFFSDQVNNVVLLHIPIPSSFSVWRYPHTYPILRLIALPQNINIS